MQNETFFPPLSLSVTLILSPSAFVLQNISNIHPISAMEQREDVKRDERCEGVIHRVCT